MQLSTGTGPDLSEPTSEQIVNAIRSLPGGDDSFVVLARSDHFFVQAAGSREEGYHLEYKELDDSRHFEATGKSPSEEELVQLFLAYARGDDSWKQQHQWEPLHRSGGSGGCGSAAGALLLLSVLVALVLAA